MSTTRILLTATALLLATSTMPALAHDDDNYGYSRHDEFHDDLSDAHRRAHEDGFYSRSEHRAYHRALRDLHQNYHGDDYDTSYRSYYSPYRRYYQVRPGYRAYWGW